VCCLHESGTSVVERRRGHRGQHCQGAGPAAAASGGTPAWRLGKTVVAGGTGTPGTSLLGGETQRYISW